MEEPEQAVGQGSVAVADTSLKTTEKPKHKGGRPSKLTPELVIALKEGFKLGMTVRRVCDLLLIAEPTFYRWVVLGREEENLGKKNGKYREFLETIRQGQAEFDKDHLEFIGKDPDWRARAWALEHMRPEQFTLKGQSDDVTMPRKGVVVVDEKADPIHILLDEARKQGSLIEVLESLTGKKLRRAALPSHTDAVILMDNGGSMKLPAQESLDKADAMRDTDPHDDTTQD